jgi:transcriptional regulator with XRE-family HTH domain
MSNLRIGKKIKRLRKSRGLTMEELASSADITKGFISQLERDKTATTVSTLKQILDVLGIDLSDFFKDFDEAEANIFFADACEQEDEGPGYKTFLLAPHKKYTEIEPQLWELESFSEIENTFEFDEAFAYLLEGQADVTVINETKTLKAGDCFYLFKDYNYKIRTTETHCRLLLTLY